ncbi:MAG: hypothetical protein WCX17_02770 [Parcubacteria group bacterium]|jgi:hypothetical protein
MAKYQKSINFCSSLYSEKSIKEATNEYKKAYGGKIGFEILKEKGYTQIKLLLNDNNLGDNIADEFSNYLLFLNIQ